MSHPESTQHRFRANCRGSGGSSLDWTSRREMCEAGAYGHVS